VLRTSDSAEELNSEDVFRAFRISKDFSLEVEPIYHRLEDRVRAVLRW
jgi:hypothetical protein